jgi:hypothetical protein
MTAIWKMYRKLKRGLAALASLALIAWLAFHAWVIVHLVQDQVLPALQAGSFDIQTSSMILTRVWEGNELYWLIAVHAALVLILAIAIARFTRFAIRGATGARRLIACQP